MSEVVEPRANPSVLGHDTTISIFERALASGRLPHAWLLLGPKGIGKATLAFALVRRLLKQAGEQVDDPASAIFRQIASGSHPDLTVLERRPHPKTGKMQSEIVVDSVREAIDAMHLTTAWNGRRVLLIDSIDELNRNAENALLKILEEPLPGTVILLVCHRAGSVPRTILSRCAQMPMRAPSFEISEQIIAKALPKSDVLNRQALCAFADSAPGQAILAAEHDLLEQYHQLLESALDAGDPTSRALAAADRLTKLGTMAGMAVACEPMLQLARRGARVAGGGTLGFEVADQEIAKLQSLSERLPLEHMLAMWDKLATLPGRIDGLKLDSHAMLFTNLRALFGERVRDEAL